MRAKTVIPSSFQDFYDSAPKEIQNYLDKAAETPQSIMWHPEGDVKTHTNIVFNRAKRTGNLNFMIAAIFHDLGKVDVTKKHATVPGKWSAHGHEVVSAHLVKKHKDWIESLGGDYDVILYVVEQHMRAKQLDQMRRSKQMTFRQHKYYDLVHQFSQFDDMTKDYSNDLD